MMRLFSFCTFLLMFLYSSAQSNEPTVVFPEGEPIQGTAILPFTRHFLSVMSSGYFPYAVEKADCTDSGEDIYAETDKIDAVIFNGNTIEIQLRIYDNCCYEFLWNPYLSDDGVLDLIYIGYGGHCNCNCCFGHKIFFKRLDYTLEDEIQIKEIRINGKSSYTINSRTK